MKIPALLPLVACLALLAGCSDSSSDTTTDTTAPTSPTAVVSTSTPPSSTPTVEPTVEPTVAPATEVPEPTAAPTKKPKKSPTPTTAAASLALASVRDDVETIAPQLESYYRDREYPEDLAQVRQNLEGSGVTLRPGNSVAGYLYDGDAVEFTLCIENTSGAWATYDTAPMSLRQSGETGGCP